MFSICSRRTGGRTRLSPSARWSRASPRPRPGCGAGASPSPDRGRTRRRAPPSERSPPATGDATRSTSKRRWRPGTTTTRSYSTCPRGRAGCSYDSFPHMRKVSQKKQFRSVWEFLGLLPRGVGRDRSPLELLAGAPGAGQPGRGRQVRADRKEELLHAAQAQRHGEYRMRMTLRK